MRDDFAYLFIFFLGDGSQSDNEACGEANSDHEEQEEKEKTDQSQQTTPTTPPNDSGMFPIQFL
jgi:hypothetical protein